MQTSGVGGLYVMPKDVKQHLEAWADRTFSDTWLSKRRDYSIRLMVSGLESWDVDAAQKLIGMGWNAVWAFATLTERGFRAEVSRKGAEQVGDDAATKQSGSSSANVAVSDKAAPGGTR